MDIRELNLTPRQQKALESMGFNTVGRVAICDGWELGLGHKTGDAIVQKARNTLAYHSIKEITCTEQQIAITLSNVSRAAVKSVEHSLKLWSGGLSMGLEGDRLTIFRPDRQPCAKCGADPTCLCVVCRASLCDKCRDAHEHEYHIAEIQYLEEWFNRARERAETFVPMPLEKRIEAEAKPSE